MLSRHNVYHVHNLKFEKKWWLHDVKTQLIIKVCSLHPLRPLKKNKGLQLSRDISVLATIKPASTAKKMIPLYFFVSNSRSFPVCSAQDLKPLPMLMLHCAANVQSREWMKDGEGGSEEVCLRARETEQDVYRVVRERWRWGRRKTLRRWGQWIGKDEAEGVRG